MDQPRPCFVFDLNEPPPPEDDGANDASPAREPSPPPPEDDGANDAHPSPSPALEPSLQDPLPPPSPVLDLEAPLSPLDEDEQDVDQEPPGPLPSLSLPTAAEPCGPASPVAPARSPSCAEGVSGDTLQLPGPPSRHGERTTPRASLLPDGETALRSSPETSAPRGPSRGTSDTASSYRSRHRPPYGPRDDAVSKRRSSYDDEGAGSSHGESRRTGPPSPRHHEQAGKLHALAIEGQPGVRPRNRRRRRPQRQQHGYQQYPGQQDQRRQGYRGTEKPQLGLRGQERPQGYQDYHGPRPHAVPNFQMQQGYSSFRSRGREDDSNHGPLSPMQEPTKIGGYQQHREAPAFKPPSSGARGWVDSYGGRRSPAREPHNGGYYRHMEAPDFRPSSGEHSRVEPSYGGKQDPAQEPPVAANGGYQQREAHRGHGHFPVRPYHPYARDAGGFGTASNAGNQGRHESRPNHQRRRNGKQSASGGPARGRQYYGDVQK